LNFCTAVNVNKNILALMLTSVVKLHSEDGGAAESPRSRAASYAATPVVEIWYLVTAIGVSLKFTSCRAG